MTTLRDVAKAARVSTVTASSVLSGSNRVRVSTATVQRIQEVARRLNYVARASARGLRTGRVRAIGFLTAAHSRSRWQAHWQEILRGMSDVLWEREEHLILAMPRTSEQEIEVLRRLAFGHQVDGLILQDGCPDDPRVALLREAGIPFVLIGGESLPQTHLVQFDMEQFGRLLTQHLLERAGVLCVVAHRRRRARAAAPGMDRRVPARDLLVPGGAATGRRPAGRRAPGAASPA